MKINFFLCSLALSFGIIACSERAQEEITTNKYHFDPTIGQFGGYSIDVTTL